MFTRSSLIGYKSELIRDMVIYDSSALAAGQALCLVSGAPGTALQDPASAGGVNDFAGVLHELPANAVTALATGTLYFGKVGINPMTIYEAMQDQAAANDVDVVSATTAAITVGTTDDNMDGGWLYANSGSGEGQLGFIGAASTTVMTLDTTDAFGTVLASDTDILLIRAPMHHQSGGGRDLDSTFVKLATDEDETGEIIVLENYIMTASIAKGPLRPRQHHNLSNLHNHAVKFSSDIVFADNIFTGLTTMASS